MGRAKHRKFPDRVATGFQFAGKGAANRAGRAEHNRLHWLQNYPHRIADRNSRRVSDPVRNAPSMVLVTILTPVLWTPRVVMHWCG